MTTDSTAYGTSSLESDERLSLRTTRRRKIIRLIFVSIGICGVCAILVIFGLNGLPKNDAVAPAETKVSAPALNSEVACVQSSYLANQTNMMEPIIGLKWTHSAVKTASSFISVDFNTKFQVILGFGGAFTEAAALQFSKLPKQKQEEVLTLYFDQRNGSAYTFGRVPMGSSDFSISSYNFDNVVNDTNLVHFDNDVTHDQKWLIPFIKRAIEVQPNLKLFLAPWSPPAWMKRALPNQEPSMLNSVKPIGIKDEARAPWALYFSKFITAYKKHGIDFWGLTPQNEPQAEEPWESCMYTAEYQADFIGNYLGPVLKRDHPGLVLMVFDHNRGSVRQWAEAIYNHPTAAQYVDGMAFHWYDNERYMDGVEYHERLNDTHYIDPSRFMLSTESCNCPGVGHGDLAWFRALRYGHDIMTDLNNHVVGWVDWNLILDHQGGPNHLANKCDAPIIMTEDEQDFFIQPMYYFIQHFSKYIPVGSRRVKTHVATQFAQPGEPQLYVDYPSMLTTCDGSSRQKWRPTNDGKLEVTGSGFCFDLKEIPWQGHQGLLVECRYTQQRWTYETDTGRIRMGAFCISLNHGSTIDEVRISTDFCEKDVMPHQQWKFDDKDGTLRSLASTTDQCVTAGYAFMQASAFVTPEDQKVLVVLNENTEPAKFELQVDGVAMETPRQRVRSKV
ncbi:family 30 glycoside hydrolase [Plasmopara halstedii]|uniref:Family 30 glycoside hydrolase n=1 Tax=Plasmopara halstedii TaxID=4781 RepID=A0A0P1AHS6_PLAHL|nr:family 30 glycoside hydrolase [Plasmopara halstedii]CEG40790.1 family 30 glycoside hydrolase [Plasmopara halstedii]|eukprot:XP_024577159.1 family 30 glycoside hydrolase [Plasmopara halstedii]